jgi:hypothetical protein
MAPIPELVNENETSIFRAILHRKTGHGDAIGSGRWIGGRSFEKSFHLLAKSLGKMAFLSTFRTELNGTPFLMRMRRYA